MIALQACLCSEPGSKSNGDGGLDVEAKEGEFFLLTARERQVEMASVGWCVCAA